MALQPDAAKVKIAITNVHIFDGQRFSDLGTVVIDDGLIGRSADVGGVDVIDGHGGYLLPGLIDAHVHLESEETLHQLIKYGITTALDMGTWPPSKLDALRGLIGLTDIRSAGVPATCPGSLHSCILPFPKGSLVSGPEQAALFVEDRVSEGVDYIKVVADVPGPSQATLNALVAAAHEHRLLAVAHATAYTPFAMAQDAKADIVTHVPLDKALDDEAVQRMVVEKRISVPTLTVAEQLTMKSTKLSGMRHILSHPTIIPEMINIMKAKRKDHGGKDQYQCARDSVTAMYRAGVPILSGTDANSMPEIHFDIIHGESLHRELELLVDASLSTVDALRAATILPAKHFHLDDRGAIETGKRADLILLANDPILDIRATRSIQRVWCGGIEVTRH